MRISTLDHVNLRTTRLEDMVAWYTEVLGLRKGLRPGFGFPGAWLYAGDQAVVHLVGIDGPEGAGGDVPLKLEHFAFSATGAASFEKLLDERGDPYRKSVVRDTGMVAYNVWDPDGNHIHVDFSLDE
jgi:catechol 2,3-dioxygenase-like lactoylglutathione lyase family enzyme